MLDGFPWLLCMSQARLRDKEEEMDHARSMLDIAIEDAHNHAREAEEALSLIHI